MKTTTRSFFTRQLDKFRMPQGKPAQAKQDSSTKPSGDEVNFSEGAFSSSSLKKAAKTVAAHGTVFAAAGIGTALGLIPGIGGISNFFLAAEANKLARPDNPDSKFIGGSVGSAATLGTTVLSYAVTQTPFLGQIAGAVIGGSAGTVIGTSLAHRWFGS